MTEETLFAEAISLPPEERAIFLDKACGDDSDLRERVEILLHSHDEAGTFLAKSAEEDHDATLAFSTDDQARTLAFPERTEESSNETPGDAGGVSAANPDAPVPFVFGNRIAQGGMGAILEADDCKFGRKIAVKVMLAEAGQSDEQKKRFVQEAAVLGKLEHPNIVPVHDLGRDSSGDLYYSMKLVKGRTLQDVINDLRNEDPDVLAYYTLDRLLTIFRKVCDAIAFAHAENIIHRDLKPENIMVGEFGEVLVMDWGISKILDGSAELIDPQSINPQAELSDVSAIGATLEGSVMGTPQYMSPEQAAGEIGEMDARSDIYSLGGILYAILTLRPPVEGSDVYEILDKVQTGDLTPITTWQKSSVDGVKLKKGDVLEAKKISPLPHIPGGRIPAALSAVAMKALALAKAERYPDIAALSADIEAYQSGFATSAEQAGLGKQLALLIKRNKGIFTTAAAAWVLITALAVMFVLNLRAKERRAVAGEEAAKTAESIALKNEEEARQSSAQANIALADSSLREGNGVAMQAALEKVPEDLRDNTWNYLHRQSDTTLKNFPPEGMGEIQDSVPHPKLPHVFAIATPGGMVTFLNIKTGERLREFKSGLSEIGWVTEMRMAISRDGERIATGQVNGKGCIAIHSSRNGKKLADWLAGKTNYLEFSADGKLLLQGTHVSAYKTSRHAMAASVWEADTGRRLWTRRPEEGDRIKLYCAFTPDGKNVIIAEGEKGPQMFRALDGEPAPDLAERRINGLATALAVSKNGSIAVADSPRLTTIFTPTNGDTKSRVPRGGGTITWAPDSRKLVTAGMTLDGRQEIEVWDTRSGHRIRSLLGGSSVIETIKVHPLSGEILVSGKNAGAWDLTGLRPKVTIESLNKGPLAFWKSDDAVITAAGTSSDLALHRISPTGNVKPVWHLQGNLRNVSVSTGGEWAAMCQVFGGSTNRIVTVRRVSDAIGEVQHVATRSHGGLLGIRMSPAGDLVLAFGGRKVAKVGTSTLKGLDYLDLSELADLERGDYLRWRDVDWLSNKRIVGVVTAKAERLEPGSEEWIVLCDPETGNLLQRVEEDSPVECIAVDPDGSRFAEAGLDKMVRIRDGKTLAIRQEFRAHDGTISAIGWHPTRPIIATASTDQKIRLWDLDSGQMIEELHTHAFDILSVSFSPSGKLLSCASVDENPMIWEPESLKDPQADAVPLDENAGKPLEKAPPPETPTSLASMLPEKEPEPDSEGWSDLLSVLTPEIVESEGNGWRMKDGIVSSTNEKEFGKLGLPGNFSNCSYHLRTRVREVSRGKVFHVALPIGDRMAGFDLDGYQGKFTGLEQINDERLNALANAIEGKQINDSEWHVLDLIVQLDGDQATVTAFLDDQDLYEWTGPVSALSHNAAWNKSADGIGAGRIALGMMAEGWEVSELRVKRLAE